MTNESDNDGWAEVQRSTWTPRCQVPDGIGGQCPNPVAESLNHTCRAHADRGDFGEAWKFQPRCDEVGVDGDRCQRTAQDGYDTCPKHRTATSKVVAFNPLTTTPASEAHLSDAARRYGVAPETAFPGLYGPRKLTAAERIPLLEKVIVENREYQNRLRSALETQLADTRAALTTMTRNRDDFVWSTRQNAETIKAAVAQRDEARANVKVLTERVAEVTKERDGLVVERDDARKHREHFFQRSIRQEEEIKSAVDHGAHYYEKWCVADAEVAELRAAPSRTVRRLLWIMTVGTALAAAAMLFTGCATPDKPRCDGVVGEHCGCAAVNCVEPCAGCCDTVPCPPSPK